MKTVAEKFLHDHRREPFARFYTNQMKELIERFVLDIYAEYFEEQFSPVFRIIKSLDMKKFACAFIIKRIYLLMGDNLPNFGFILIRAIAQTGGIKA